MNGFNSCGLWPFDPNVLTDVDFEAALVTDEHMPDQEASSDHCPLIEDTSAPFSLVEDLPVASKPPSAADAVPTANTPADTDSRQPHCTSDDVPCSCSLSHCSRLCGADVDVLQVSGDGRCLFRSLVTAMDSKLQTADRDEHGVLANPILEMCEQTRANEL